MTDNDRLTIKQKRTVAALIQHRTIGDAAVSIGVAEKTIYRWMKQAVFIRALQKAESELISLAVNSLVTDLGNNFQTMKNIRDDRKNQPNVRLRAAIALDNSLLRWRELSGLEERITMLEEAILNG